MCLYGKDVKISDGETYEKVSKKIKETIINEYGIPSYDINKIRFTSINLLNP